MALPGNQNIDCQTGDQKLDEKIKEWLDYDQVSESNNGS